MKFAAPDIRISENTTLDTMHTRSGCSVQYKWMLFCKLLTTRDVAEYNRLHHEITHNGTGRGSLPTNPRGF